MSENNNKEDNNFSISNSELKPITQRLKKIPNFKDFNDDQLRSIAEICVYREFEAFSGPLPSPKLLKDYETISPGTANRIIKMAEGYAKNRVELNKKEVEADIKRSNRGQALGFILSVLFIAGAVLCAFFKQPWPASIIGLTGFSSIISIFVLGKR